MFRVIRKIRAFNLILKAYKKEPNDSSLGYRVRRIMNFFLDKKEIKEEEIFKETPKP